MLIGSRSICGHAKDASVTESDNLVLFTPYGPASLQVGRSIIASLKQHTRVQCGFAAIADVRDGTHEDKMDSFLLAETFKYGDDAGSCLPACLLRV